MFAVGASRKIAHVSSLEGFIQQRAAIVERQRAESPAACLGRCLQRRDLRCVSRRGRWSGLHQTRFSITMGERHAFLVVANPAEKVVDGFVLPFAADRRRQDGSGHITQDELLIGREVLRLKRHT